MAAGVVRRTHQRSSPNDSEFRARLIADPKGTVEQECGITFPDSYTFHVCEETATDTYMILPQSSQLILYLFTPRRV